MPLRKSDPNISERGLILKVIHATTQGSERKVLRQKDGKIGGAKGGMREGGGVAFCTAPDQAG